VEVVNVRLSAFGGLPSRSGHPEPSAEAPSAPPARLGRVPASARAGTVAARLPGTAAPRELPVYQRDQIGPGRALAGPAIVHQLDTTTVVLPGQRARADELGSLWLEEAR
jgi:N-methylhydantoinase A